MSTRLAGSDAPDGGARRGLAHRLTSIDDGTLMRFVFFIMLAGVTAVLALDYRDLRIAAAANAPGLARPMLPGSPSLLPGSGSPAAPEVTGDPDILRQAMTIELGAKGELRLTGAIFPGTGERFSAEIERIGEYVKTVVLNSPGGSVYDAIDMSLLIREKGYGTRVEKGSLCASSCPILLAGGKERIADREAAIGIHQVSPVQVDPARPIDGARESQSVTAAISRHLSEMGVDPALWLHALETPADQLYYLSPEELERYRLATEPGGQAPRKQANR